MAYIYNNNNYFYLRNLLEILTGAIIDESFSTNSQYTVNNDGLVVNEHVKNNITYEIKFDCFYLFGY